MDAESYKQMEGRFARSATDVVLTGDRIEAGIVEYFVCDYDGQGPPQRRFDRAAVARVGEPRRLLDLERARVARTATSGLRPILRLPAAFVVEGTPEIAKNADEQLSRFRASIWRGGKRVRTPVRDALERVACDGYDVWVTGGLVRDLLRSTRTQTTLPAQGDLDLVGSVPPGTFCERMSEFLGRAELPMRLNPINGVVVVFADPGRQSRLLEYGVLKSSVPSRLPDGAPSLAFGCDLKSDAEWRDLTVNTFCYDWRTRYVIDPTGVGCSDLDPITLRPPSEPKDWPGHLFRILFRYFKFMKRWPDADFKPSGDLVGKHFNRLRRERDELGSEEMIRLSEPFGDSPAERSECLEELARRLAPDHDWGDFFEVKGGAP